MQNFRPWAFWRRIQYATGFLTFLTLVFVAVHYSFFYAPPNCFDTIQNGTEIGLDCGGACTRICAFTVAPPTVTWAKSFEVIAGQYNAVAYIENKNRGAGTPTLQYVFKLSDRAGLITERRGSTVLPPDSTYPVFEGRIDTFGRVPTETTLELLPADTWLPSTFGRGQFKTVDINLVEADARPKLKVKMENTELIEAKNVEVVATIFDARGIPLTASQTFVDIFPGRSQADLVFTWPHPIAKTIRSCAVPTDIVVAIDLSGSMNNDGGNPPEPISSVRTAASTFVSNLRPDDRIAVVTFATTASTPLQLASDAGTAAARIKQLSIDPTEETGSTNTGEGLIAAQAELRSSRHNPDARKVVVLLTDGLATGPDIEPELYAKTQADVLKADGVTLYTIGLGSSVNMEFLQALASTPTQAFAAPTTDILGSIYQTITASICEDGAAKIDVIPKASGNFPPL
jgi:Mg-chelatase subunit ChlD